MTKEKLIKFCDYFIEGALLALVFFVPLIFDFTGSINNIVETPKAVFFRSVLAVVLIVYVLKIFLAGRIVYRGSRAFFFWLLLLASSFFISSFFSIHPGLSFWGEYFRQQGFYVFSHYWLLALLLILNLRDFKQIKRLIIAALAAACLVSLYGLIQYVNLDPMLWTEKAVDLKRIYSSFGQPNWLGHFLVIVLPLGFYALFFLAKKLIFRLMVGLAIVLEFLCLILTYSRAAWLGLMGALMFFLMVWLFHKNFKKTALMLALAIFIGLTSIIGLNFIKPVEQGYQYKINLVNRIKSIVNLRGGSNKMRLYYLSASFEEFVNAKPLRKLIGYGPETLTGVFIKYYQPEWGLYEAINGTPDRAHNWLFDQLLSLGIAGLIITLAFYAWLSVKIIKLLFSKTVWEEKDWLLAFLSASLVAYSINNLFSFSLLTNLFYLYLFLALVWLLINSGEQERTVELSLTATSRALIGFSLFMTTAVFIYTNNINQVRAEFYYTKAKKAMQIPDCNQAMNNLEKVMALSPNNNYFQENYLFFAANCLPLLESKADRLVLAQAGLARVEAAKDQDFSNWQINLARFYAMLGLYLNPAYFNEAEKIFSQLVAANPYLTPALEDYGRMKMLQGDYRAAVSLFKQAADVIPPRDHPGLSKLHREKNDVIAVRLYEALGQALTKLGEYESAEEYYKSAIKIDPYRATAYKGLADIYYLRADLDRAIQINKRGLVLSPRDYHWPLALSLLFREKKDLIMARNYLDRALELAPENPELIKYQQELNGKN